MALAANPPSGEFAPAFLSRLFGALPALLLVTDEDGRIGFNAGTFGNIGGRRTPADLTGLALADYVDRDQRDEVLDLLRAAARTPPGEVIGPMRVAYRDADDILRTTETWAINQMNDPEISGLVLLFLPETSYDRFDQILMQIVGGAALESTFAALVQSLRYPPVDADGYFVMLDDDDRGVTRVPDRSQLPGPPGPGPWDAVLSDGESRTFTEVNALPANLAQPAIKAGFASVGCHAVRPQVDERARVCLVTWSRSATPPPPNALAAIDRVAAIASLAISHRSVAERLRDAAYRDMLTGLGNRRGFFEALEQQIAQGDQPAVLYIDLDGFKAVNDTLGHLAGDAVLRVAARRLASVMRPTDELARLGGDEFAVLCVGSVSVDQMSGIAERVIEQLNQPLSVGDGESVDVGASIGIALGLPVGTPADAILAHADRALYEAKSKGRGRYAFADPRQEIHP
jgi:diguanylate cyclase (GGDEF)-like protein